MPKKVLITGGSGFLGINLVRFLLKKKYIVTVYDIADFEYSDCRHKINFIKGDIRNFKLLDKSMVGQDFVVHTAAALPLYSPKDIYSTDITGTKNVITASVKNKIQRFVHISSTAVYGIPDHHPLKEEDKLSGVGPYGIAKIKAEEVCLSQKSKICLSIIRPKTFVGPERLGVFALLYDWAYSGCNFPVIGNGNNLYQLLDVEDLCQAIYNCLTLDQKQVKKIFNIGAKKFDTIRHDYQSVLNKAGFGKKIISTPKFLIINILRLLEKLKLSPLYKWVYETAAEDSFVSIEKAEKYLNFKPKYSSSDALLRNYSWYLKNLKNFQNSSGISHRVPWKQGLLVSIKPFFK